MIKKIFVIALLSFSFIKNSNAQTDPNFIALNNLDFDYYLNKPIDSLLSAIPIFLPSQLKIYGYADCHKASRLAVTYPNQVVLLVRPKNFQFMNSVDTNRVWDINLFKKETAWFIELFYEGRGIKDAIVD